MTVGFIISDTDLFRLRMKSQIAVFSSFAVGFANAARVSSHLVAVTGMTESGERVVFTGRRLVDKELLVDYAVAEHLSTGEVSHFSKQVAGFTRAALSADFGYDFELVALETVPETAPTTVPSAAPTAAPSAAPAEASVLMLSQPSASNQAISNDNVLLLMIFLVICVYGACAVKQCRSSSRKHAALESRLEALSKKVDSLTNVIGGIQPALQTSSSAELEDSSAQQAPLSAIILSASATSITERPDALSEKDVRVVF